MAKGFASLGDKMADKKIPCRVRGCPRTWLWRGSDQAKAFSSGQTTPPARMCDLCHARAQTLSDQTIACTTAGCDGTFLWTKLAQLEAIVRQATSKLAVGEKEAAPIGPPKYLCEKCLAKVQAIGDRQVPCRVKGCDQTWTWSGRAQLAAGEAAEPPSRMCDACHELYESLRDEPRPCKVRGCSRRWIYSRWQQLESGKGGRGAAGSEPPTRMCDECLRAIRALGDQELPCRTDGCDGKWTWTRLQQRESELAGEATAPARMCPSCQSKFSQLKDVSAPCKRSGCKGTWIYKRGAQLERWVKQGEGPEHGPPHRLCEACRKGLDQFQDREVRCKNDGCSKTWTWTRFAQLQARDSGHGDTPPSHVCDECREFLKAHPTKTLTCGECGAETHWAPELQLKVKLGLMVEPTQCAACKRKAADAARHAHRSH